ncbi:MAG: IS110 family transposase [Rhodospirillaceae bacterium]|nr:IS110 family transposase [Rhodospirillaceae bacterium]
MEYYVGLDVSLAETSICVVDDDGKIVCEGTVISQPAAIAEFIETKAKAALRIGLETGPTATWLWHELHALGLAVICIDARHAKAALSMQINKSDRNDAYGLARIMQAGWYKEVQVKRLGCHEVRAVLNSRALLVKIKRDLGNQIRGLLKNLGLIIGKANGNVFSCRVENLVAENPHLQQAVRPLLAVREMVSREISDLDRRLLVLARDDVESRRLMTVPGIGPITALAFRAAIDEPARFKRSRSVGAYFGLTPRRYASGEMDWSGRISKCGDSLVRTYLFEAAGVLLTRVPHWCKLKAWGLRLVKRIGFKKAKVAVARKLAVILHRMWCDGTDFQWLEEEATA